MTTAGVIVVMLIAIGSTILAVLTAVAVSGLMQARRDRLEPAFQYARRAIVAALSGDESETKDALASLSRFSERDVVKVMLDLAPSVSGTSRSVLVSMAEQLGVIQRARSGLRWHRWSTRLYSARVLSAFGVDSKELCALLTDRSPEVRAQAAAWAVITTDPETIAGLIGLLDDSDGLCCFAAQDALIRIGIPAADALNDALEMASGTLVPRILTVAAAMGDERFFRLVSTLATDPLPETRAMAAAVLARIGDPTSGPTVVPLLEDPSPDVRLAAAAALAKLQYWPAAPYVEPLLNDPSWELRRQASVTLLAMGAPGLILLRDTAPGDGPAADMAVQALQLRSLHIDEEVT